MINGAGVVFGRSRQGDGLNSQISGFAGSADGAGVHHVSADVQSPVNTGDHQVEFQLQPQNSEPDAVSGGGIHGPGCDARFQFHLPGFKVFVQLNAMAFSALFIFGDHGGDFTQLAAPLDQRQQLRGIDAVVVGDQNSHNHPSCVSLYSLTWASASRRRSSISWGLYTVAPLAQA